MVSVDGYMIPIEASAKVLRFALVADPPGEGRPSPPIAQVLIATTPTGFGYRPGHLRVWGRLHVRPSWDDGFLTGLYSIDASRLDVLTDPLPWGWVCSLGTLAAAAGAVGATTWIRHRRADAQGEGGRA